MNCKRYYNLNVNVFSRLYSFSNKCILKYVLNVKPIQIAFIVNTDRHYTIKMATYE